LNHSSPKPKSAHKNAEAIKPVEPASQKDPQGVDYRTMPQGADESRMQILLIEDHPLVAIGLVGCIKLIEASAEILRVDNASDARNIYNRESPQLVILDLFLKDGDGHELLDFFRSSRQKSRTVIFSGNASEGVIRDCLERGAAGFIPKGADQKEITRALEVVINGGSYTPPTSMHTAELRSVPRQSREENKIYLQSIYPITNQQFKVLEYALIGKTNQVIAENLGLATNTVRNHMSKILEIMEVKNRSELVYKVSRLNFLISYDLES